MNLVSRTIDKRERRARREAELGERQRALPDQRYGVILADPPWRFEPYSRITGMDRAADNHYPTSAFEEIKALAVGSIAAPDCVLFLWATVPMQPQAHEVMAAWGFAYKSNLVWVKDRVGTGYWSRNKHELLLIGTRGRVPAPAPGTNGRRRSRRPSEDTARSRRSFTRSSNAISNSAKDRASRSRR
jgi:N6-adenosine-specific RNA methylase IME4